jgi:hypothetical protein
VSGVEPTPSEKELGLFCPVLESRMSEPAGMASDSVIVQNAFVGKGVAKVTVKSGEAVPGELPVVS